MSIEASINCPSCRGQLKPKVLVCDNCDIRVEGPFELNEFAALAPEDLHFLRIFIRSEGRIRDMEPALGLSYPTIRTRLSELNDKLTQISEKAAFNKIKPESSQDALEKLGKGEISFDEAMAAIKKSKRKKT